MYSFTSTVRYSECDSEGNLTIPALINYLQDCSTFHTESVGHGVRYCAEHGFAWFISAWQISIGRLPRFCEDVTISTWSFARRPTMANRNFTVVGEGGATLVEADSLWFPYDTQRGRPVRIPASEYVYLGDDAPLDLPPTQRKLVAQGDPTTFGAIPVTEQHLDSNRHVNNGQYVAMASHVVQGHDARFATRRLLVQYRQAAKLGDVIVPRLYVEDRGYAVDLASDAGKSFALVRMEG